MKSSLFKASLLLVLLLPITVFSQQIELKPPLDLSKYSLDLRPPPLGNAHQVGNWLIGTSSSLLNRSQTITTIGLISENNKSALLVTCFGDNRLEASISFDFQLPVQGNTIPVTFSYDNNRMGTRARWDILVKSENAKTFSGVSYPSNYSADKAGDHLYSNVIMFVRSLYSASTLAVNISDEDDHLSERFDLGKNKKAIQQLLYACSS